MTKPIPCAHVYIPSKGRWDNCLTAQFLLRYVTDGFGYSGVKRIRACSSLEEVSTASASDLFKRFSRLGVYTWDDILRTANGDPNRDIMALRFSYTEMFPQPIMLGQLGDVLQNIEGKSLMLHGPSELDPRTFEALYSIGTRRN